ncbi:hypothetical protein [Alsobacter sp. R-9]
MDPILLIALAAVPASVLLTLVIAAVLRRRALVRRARERLHGNGMAEGRS